MRKNKSIQTSFYDLLIFLPVMPEEVREENMQKLNEAKAPEYLGGAKCPENLDAITFGQYTDLCEEMKREDQAGAMVNLCKIVLGIPEDKIMQAPAMDVWGFCVLICKEVTKITEMFNSINLAHSNEELQAGVDRLKFGLFGMLDWYARRMGITDHNQVNEIKWVRIYQCLKNDTEESAYQRRLQKVYNDKIKVKR